MKKPTLLMIAVFTYSGAFVHAGTTSAHSPMIPTNPIFHQRHLGDSGNQINLLDVEGCKPLGQCEMCPGGKRSGKSGCEVTGRRREFVCDDAGPDATDDDGSNPEVKYQSCKRTTVDEEYLMFQLQAICVMVAFIAIRSVRREKMLSESLFDQRKRRARQQQQQQQQDMFTPLTTAAFGLASSSNDSGNNSLRDSNVIKDDDDSNTIGSRGTGSEDELDTSGKVFDKV